VQKIRVLRGALRLYLSMTRILPRRARERVMTPVLATGEIKKVK